MPDLALTDRLPEWLETEGVLTDALALGEYSDETDVERLLAEAGLTTELRSAMDVPAPPRFTGVIQ